MSQKNTSQKQEITIRRKGGGTLIENRPVFSPDGKYVYVNCVWGIRIFSVNTGECVRVFETGHKIAAVLSYENGPLSIGDDGSVFKWEPHTNKAIKSVVEKFHLLPKYSAIDAHFVPNISDPTVHDICIVMKNKANLRLMFYNPDTGNVINHPMNDTQITYFGTKHSISFGGFKDKVIYASIAGRNLNVCTIDGTESMKRSDNSNWTCVRCHEYETIVAAGDSTGRVVLWKNPFHPSSSAAQCVYHWHTLPCREIAFTPAGTSMYTGGGEHVLVKWNVDNPLIRHYLPRLSSEIVHITVSPDNLLIAVATLDNGIQIVESHNRIESLRCVLQQLTWGVLTIPGAKLFPAGLSYDKRTGALVLNGRPGHLQFYSPQSESLLFNVDVTQRNILTQERNKIITNTEVTHCALSNDGFWMATIETRDEEGTALEIRLKLWQFIPSNQRYSLNTSIERPHNGFVYGLQFNPAYSKLSSGESNLDYMLATTGSDKKFRIWTPNDIDSIYKKGVVWGCESVGFYRDRECGSVSFSEDGSLLAVSFVESLTIWDIDNMGLKTSITRLKKPIRSVQFGRHECCHLIVTCTDDELHVWNLLTLTLVWFVRIESVIHVSDPCSYFQAVFTKNGSGFVFNPLEHKPVYSFKYNIHDAIVCAAFIPRETVFHCETPWLQHSQLYYIDSYQELKVFECEEENSGLMSVPFIQDKAPSTLFSSLVASQQTLNTVQYQKQKYLQFGVLGSSAITELLKAPAHTMPPIGLLCGSLLQSLILTKKKDKTEKMEEDEIISEQLDISEDEDKDETSKKSNDLSFKFLTSELKKITNIEKSKTEADALPETDIIHIDNDDDDNMNVELEFFEDVKGDIEDFTYK